jgi:hypothetical protein
MVRERARGAANARQTRISGRYREEVRTMLLNEMHLHQVKRDREREIRQRIRERRQLHQLASRSVRRAVGRSIMSIGARLAAEPQPRLARSR